MKNRILLLTTAIIIGSLFFTPSLVLADTCNHQSNSVTISSNSIEPRKDEIGYQYTVINGVLYKRLYNFSQNKPLGDWEVVK